MIVITGAGGFIGSVLAAALNDGGRADIIIVDRFGNDEKWRNIAKREFVDILDPVVLMSWLDGASGKVEAIFHLGANSSTTETNADSVIASNLKYSIGLWRWCATNGVRFIYASSAATYGSGEAGFDDSSGISQLKRLRPLNLYGWSKHAFDLWALRETADGRSPPFWAGLKLFNVFGPNEYHKGSMMSLVAKNYNNVRIGAPVQLFKSHHPGYGDGGQMRDFIYVKDCVAVMVWMLYHGSHAGIFNVGTGQARSFRDLIGAVGKACEFQPDIEYVDMPSIIRSNYQYFTEAMVERLRQAGYIAPFTPLETAVTDYVTQHLAAADPYV